MQSSQKHKAYNSIIILGLLFLINCSAPKFTSDESNSDSKSTGETLQYDSLALMVNGEQIQRSSFIYGEIIEVKFLNIRGFNALNGRVFPGLSMTVIAQNGDTIGHIPDFYVKAINGVDHNQLKIAPVLVAKLPTQINKKSLLHIGIWDKNGRGKLAMQLPFTIVPNEKIKAELIGCVKCSYDVIYLWDETTKRAITDNTIPKDHGILLIIEGLKGFNNYKGNVYPDMTITLRDGNDEQLAIDMSVFSKYYGTGIPYEEFSSSVHTSLFKFYDNQVYQNPVKLDIFMFDRKPSPKTGQPRIKIQTYLTIED